MPGDDIPRGRRGVTRLGRSRPRDAIGRLRPEYTPVMTCAAPDGTVYTILESPIGRLLISGTREGVLVGVSFVAGRIVAAPNASWLEDRLALEETAREMGAYFAGRLRQFTVPLDLRGTPFQRRVWSALLDIPYGETRTYSDIAARIGAPASVRAVGLANGQNPIPIVVPCHRVIGKDGRLVGYGGGLDTKRALLDLEQGSLFHR
jgi:methylated-DNA-[protein]-cysteine S-methyltransferase